MTKRYASGEVPAPRDEVAYTVGGPTVTVVAVDEDGDPVIQTDPEWGGHEAEYAHRLYLTERKKTS